LIFTVLTTGCDINFNLQEVPQKLRSDGNNCDNSSGRAKKPNKKGKMNKKTIRLGTWNVRTMLPPGKMSETAREMRRYKIEILAIQETRWSGKGKIDKTNYTLYYAGEKKQGKNGTAFLVGGGDKKQDNAI
jgi:hypothetical protein